jgi:hypothetical protein
LLCSLAEQRQQYIRQYVHATSLMLSAEKSGPSRGTAGRSQERLDPSWTLPVAAIGFTHLLDLPEAMI